MSKAEQFIDEVSRYTQAGIDRGLLAPRKPYQPGTSLHDREPNKLWDDFLMGVQLLNQVANTLGRNRDTVRAAAIIKQRMNEMLNIYEQLAPKQPEDFRPKPVFRR